MEKITTKQLGDAGEYFALSQFSFAGKAATKMPDNWKAYDLVVADSDKLLRVSVKTRSETDKWGNNSFFTFNDQDECDLLVFIFKSKAGVLRSWIIPFDVAEKNAHNPRETCKSPHDRDVRWAKLQNQLSAYENNWSLTKKP